MKLNKKIISVSVFLIIGVSIILLYMFKLRSFQVDFDPQGGTWIATVQVRIHKTVPRPNDPIRENYVFDGWYLDEKTYDFNSPVTQDLTLVAHWKEK